LKWQDVSIHGKQAEGQSTAALGWKDRWACGGISEALYFFMSGKRVIISYPSPTFVPYICKRMVMDRHDCQNTPNSATGQELPLDICNNATTFPKR